MGKTCSTYTELKVNISILIGKRHGNRKALGMRKDKKDFLEIGCKGEDWPRHSSSG
jgi:hypothetical protein